ncbi:MAG: hypothetical protein LBD06_12660 [Candidatus Accumulibacter sp.]|nr:hypothetical protein [Accumulibacter sp.]
MRRQKTVPEDRSLRGQMTDELAALRAVRRTENRVLGFRGQRFERTEDKSTCGASRRGMDEKPGARFCHLIRREAPKFICHLSSQTAVLWNCLLSSQIAVLWDCLLSSQIAVLWDCLLSSQTAVL